jgi:hypothetical protein
MRQHHRVAVENDGHQDTGATSQDRLRLSKQSLTSADVFGRYNARNVTARARDLGAAREARAQLSARCAAFFIDYDGHCCI